MTHIVVTDDQARQIADGSLPIVFVDSTGRQIVRINQLEAEPAPPENLSPDDWAEIVRRTQTSAKYSTFQEIKSRLGWTGNQ